MKRRQRLSAVAAAVGMIILILDGKTAVAGAQAGIQLCLKTVIPSLFPFFVLSSMITRGNTSGNCILIPAFLGGYPVGAENVGKLFKNNQISQFEAERLLAFCSNAGPAFLFGMVGQMFSEPWMAWALWGIHIAGAAAAAFRFPVSLPVISQGNASQNSSGIMRPVTVMAAVCGWIILFRVGIAFLDRWIMWLVPPTVRVAIIGFLELSNGCWELQSVSDTRLRFLLCAGMLSAGGLCVTMQTVSVTNGLSLRYYFRGKLIQTAVSLILGASLMYRTLLPLVLLPGFLLAKKRCSIPVLSGV